MKKSKRWAVFLRGVNVGGKHIVKMAELKTALEAAGFADVTTFLASGNVWLTLPETDGARLEKALEIWLAKFAGFDIAAFARPAETLDALARFPSAGKESIEVVSENILFLKTPLTAAQTAILRAITPVNDVLVPRGSEIYWQSGGRQSDSKFSHALFEKKIGAVCTIRSRNTVEKMAARQNTEG